MTATLVPMTISEQIGSRQVLLLLLIGLNYAIVSINHTLPTFQGYTPHYFCQVDNVSAAIEGCVKEPNMSALQNDKSCPGGYQFESERGDWTVVTEWQLVCERRVLRPMLATLYFCGVTVGAIVCGLLADRYGRRPLVLICLYSQGILGISLYFTKGLETFMVLRFIQGFFVQGVQGTTYALLVEMFPQRFRTAVGVVLELYWALGLVFLAGAAYCIPNWRTLQLVLAVPTVITLLYVCLVPESVRWLITHGKQEEAEKVLSHMFQNKQEKISQATDDVINKKEKEIKSSRNSVRLIFQDIHKKITNEQQNKNDMIKSSDIQIHINDIPSSDMNLENKISDAANKNCDKMLEKDNFEISSDDNESIKVNATTSDHLLQQDLTSYDTQQRDINSCTSSNINLPNIKLPNSDLTINKLHDTEDETANIIDSKEIQNHSKINGNSSVNNLNDTSTESLKKPVNILKENCGLYSNKYIVNSIDKSECSNTLNIPNSDIIRCNSESDGLNYVWKEVPQHLSEELVSITNLHEIDKDKTIKNSSKINTGNISENNDNISTLSNIVSQELKAGVSNSHTKEGAAFQGKSNETENKNDHFDDDNVVLYSSSVNKCKIMQRKCEGSNSNIPRKTKRTGTVQLFKNKILRKYNLVMVFVWFSVSLSYYGIMFHLPDLSGERHLNFLLGAILEVISYVLAYIILSRFGRRLPMASYLFVSGIICIVVGAISVIPKEEAYWIGQTQTMLALLGKAAVVSGFCTMFLYASELFPTVLRAAAMGHCGLWGRVGSLLAPQLLFLGEYTLTAVPLIIMGLLGLLAGVLVFILPETLGQTLPDTIEEVEEFAKLKNKN